MEAASRPRPIRRFLARQFDNSLTGLLLIFIVWFGTRINLLSMYRGVNSFVLWIPVLILWALADTDLLFFGLQSPGRWLFRIQIHSVDVNPPTFWRALDRSIGVLFIGQGAGNPLVFKYAGIRSYTDLAEGGTTHWDRGRFHVACEPPGTTRILLAIAASPGLLVVLAVYTLLSILG